MLRSWMLGGLGGLLLVSSAWAGPGTVKTRDGQTFSGEIAEQGEQVVVIHKGIKTSIARNEIRSITYTNSIEQDYRRRLAKLRPYDVNGRLQLAHWLFESKAYGLAIEVLADARQIQPHNPDVFAMMRTVDRQVLLEEREARKHAPVELAAADQNPRNVPQSQPARQASSSNEMLTPDEINEVKQSEWKEGEPIRVRFANDVRRKYIAYKQLDRSEIADFNRRTPAEQAAGILKYGTDDMKRDVLLGDPPAITQYKVIQRSIVSGCANCHSSSKPAGGFALRVPMESEAATYTNFVILQKYKLKVRDKTYMMLDREHPDQSLLVEFALPYASAPAAHPHVNNYNGVVRTPNDPRLQKVITWLGNLKLPPSSDYSDIDVGGSSGPPPASQQKRQ